MRALLIETDYREGIIIEGELADTVKLIDKVKRVSIAGDKVALMGRKIKYAIVEVVDKAELEVDKAELEKED